MNGLPMARGNKLEQERLREKIRILRSSDAHVIELFMAGMAENINRQALPPVDVADGLRRLHELDIPKDRLASLFGMDIRTIERFLRIGAWSARAKDRIATHRDTFNTRILLDLASRRLSEEQLLEALDARIDGRSVPV